MTLRYQQTSEPHNTSLRHLHILLVDDEPAFRAVTKSFLNNSGFSVITAKDGNDAIEIMSDSKKSGKVFDLLITDNRMPNMNGVELLRRIKIQRMDLPVIVISGCIEESLLTELKLVTQHKFMAKPVNHQELLLNIRLLTTSEEGT